MSKYQVIVVILVAFIVGAVLAIGASALGSSNEEDFIHIDSAPAYACVGEGC